MNMDVTKISLVKTDKYETPHSVPDEAQATHPMRVPEAVEKAPVEFPYTLPTPLSERLQPDLERRNLPSFDAIA